MSDGDEAVEVLALIPARGGSKSVPRKNILLVGGKPLIAYSIQHARDASLINRIVVSTDDEEIAGIAREFGAETPFMRPAEFAQDHSPDIDVFQHALEWFHCHEGYQPDIIVHLRPPMPIRLPSTIDRAISTFIDHPEADSLRSVNVATQSPYKMWLINPDGLGEPAAVVDGLAEAYNMPRQRLPIAYWQNGYIDVLRPHTLFELDSMSGNNILPFVIEEQCVDIDYWDAIPLVEKLLRQRLGEITSVGPAEKSPVSERHPS